MDGGVVGVVLDKYGFDVQKPAPNLDAEVLVETMAAPLGPRLTDLVDAAARCNEMGHLFGDGPRRKSFQVLLKPLAGNRLPRDVARELALAQRMFEFRQGFGIGQPRHRLPLEQGLADAPSATTINPCQ